MLVIINNNIQFCANYNKITDNNFNNNFMFLLVCFFTLVLGLYIGFPIAIILFPKILSFLVFMNSVKNPRCRSQLHDPKKEYDLDGVDNAYIEASDGNYIGLWKMAPFRHNANCAPKVILYCHGNSFHRGHGHRLKLYEVLRGLGYWVVTFDYRGYGDSTGTVTEESAVQDVLTAYKFMDEEFPDACKVVIWAHSLGTSLASKAVCEMQNKKFSRQPDALVLEAPFDSIKGIMDNYPISKFLLSLYPSVHIRRKIDETMAANGMHLNTRGYLLDVKTPVMILHAEDDNRVLFKLGYKLYKYLKNKFQDRVDVKPRFVKFVRFQEKHHLGHNCIYSHCGVCTLLQEFVEECCNKECSQPKFREIEM